MILQALYEYYQRKSADPENTDMAPAGWQWKEIPFVLVLDKDGNLVAIDDHRDARHFLVPQENGRSSNIAAYFLWDKPEYIWGIAKGKNSVKLQKYRQNFLDVLRGLAKDALEDIGVQAALKYLASPETALAQAEKCDNWKYIYDKNYFVALRLNDDDYEEDGRIRLICNRPAVKASYEKNRVVDYGRESICLVTGEKAFPLLKHNDIKIDGDGVKIVSFNAPAYSSYGKEQGENAPISEAAADAYTKALNYLLRKGSPQKVRLGDITVVFWAHRNKEIENDFSFLFGNRQKDDPDDVRVRAIQTLLESPYYGGGAELSAKDNFYILGLSPNAARLSVRFWLPVTVKNIQDKLRKFFNETRLEGEKIRYPSIFSLLSSLALKNKLDNLPRGLQADFLRSIVSDAPYPATILSTALNRMRAERKLPPLRAAIIKAYLIRNSEKEILMSLDENNTERAYLYGRLFAVMQKTQEEALGDDVKATIVERFFSAASSSPGSVFSTIQKLHKHHLNKIKRTNFGRAVNIEKRMMDIIEKLPAEPYKCSLSLEEQGLFSIGYYHQRQALFTAKAEKIEKQAA